MRLQTGSDLRAERARRGRVRLAYIARRIGRTASGLGTIEREDLPLSPALREQIKDVFAEIDGATA